MSLYDALVALLDEPTSPERDARAHELVGAATRAELREALAEAVPRSIGPRLTRGETFIVNGQRYDWHDTGPVPSYVAAGTNQ